MRISKKLAISICLISCYSVNPLAYCAGDSLAVKQQQSATGGGSLAIVNESGKNKSQCPLKHTDVVAEISGYIARVTVEQEFSNPNAQTIDALYTFPLSHFSKVEGITVKMGTGTMAGEIIKSDPVMLANEEAGRDANSPPMLDQERSHIFRQSVANIAPHSTIKIQIVYSDFLPYRSGGYSFHFPVMAGSRSSPDPADGDLSLMVNLDAGVNFANLQSKLHPITTTNRSEKKATISLARAEETINRDFVLSWTVAGSELKTGYLTHKDGPTGYFTIMIVPPAKPTAEQVKARELVFIFDKFDKFGSQSGLPLQKARATMLYILEHLNAQDTFQVMSLNNGAEMLFARPQPLSANTMIEAKKYVTSLQADGGSAAMQLAIAIASADPAPDNRLRVFVLMTDDYSGNDKELIDLVKKTRASSRWFTLASAKSDNRLLMDQVATAGGGEAEFVLLNSPWQKVAEQFNAKLAGPVLTNISIKLDGLELANLNASVIRDLWANRPVYITGKYLKAGKGTATVQGLQGGLYEHKFALELPASNSANSALADLWAPAQGNQLTANGRSDLRAQVSSTVAEQRRYPSGWAERDQKRSGPPVKIFSKTDLTLVKAANKTIALRPEEKIDADLQKSMSFSTKIQDDSSRLHLKIKLAPIENAEVLSLLLNKLQIKVLTTNSAGDQMIAVVPARRINELARSKLIARLSLAQ